ncbi:sunset domain-containing protein [Hyphococcus sp.]|uniref:sunset domain-containing protein n=1 Tax=Hyphococcus sp. TaxID=2038636 RepID=UPI00208A9CBF|nr:MAG: hypothetical protein DHS20C04_02640 [Marinicaulis sp.]
MAGYVIGGRHVPHPLRIFPAKGCVIKGNVSQNVGARIYHVPGQKYYAGTVISPERGERWFCSESEARQAGWRRAGR